MTCPNCKTIVLTGKRCSRCRYNFNTQQVDHQFLRGKNCPKCGSEKVVHLPKWKKSPIERELGFTPLPLQECTECQHVWEPSAPKWVLIGGAALCLGLALLGLLFSVQTAAGGPRYFVGFILFGGMGFYGCVRRLFPKKPQK